MTSANSGMTFPGDELGTGGARKARGEYMGEFKKHGVYAKVPLQESRGETGRDPIGAIWWSSAKGIERARSLESHS